jgi:hypothetical protein
MLSAEVADNISKGVPFFAKSIDLFINARVAVFSNPLLTITYHNFGSDVEGRRLFYLSFY